MLLKYSQLRGPVMKRLKHWFGVRPPDFSLGPTAWPRNSVILCALIYKVGVTTDMMVVEKTCVPETQQALNKYCYNSRKKTSLPIYQLNYGEPFRN